MARKAGEDKGRRPKVTAAKAAERAAREARLAEALRENLRKRKAQARGRGSGESAARDDEKSSGTEKA